jgi:hypothetical protein
METKEELEKRQLQLQNDKTQAELSEILRPWYKRPAYIAALSPIVLALIAFLGAALAGYFDSSRRQLQIENRTIATGIEKLKEERSSLGIQVQNLNQQKAELQKTFDNRQASLSHQIQDLEAQKTELQKTVVQLRNPPPPQPKPETSHPNSEGNLGSERASR